jgi:hypothetical protein
MMGIMVILSRCTCGFFAYKVRTSLPCFTDESIHFKKNKTLRIRSLDTELLYVSLYMELHTAGVGLHRWLPNISHETRHLKENL